MKIIKISDLIYLEEVCQSQVSHQTIWFNVWTDNFVYSLATQTSKLSNIFLNQNGSALRGLLKG